MHWRVKIVPNQLDISITLILRKKLDSKLCKTQEKAIIYTFIHLHISTCENQKQWPKSRKNPVSELDKYSKYLQNCIKSYEFIYNIFSDKTIRMCLWSYFIFNKQKFFIIICLMSAPPNKSYILFSPWAWTAKTFVDVSKIILFQVQILKKSSFMI